MLRIDTSIRHNFNLKPLNNSPSKLLLSILILSLLFELSIFPNSPCNSPGSSGIVNFPSFQSNSDKLGLLTFSSIHHILKCNQNFHDRYTNGNKRQHGIRIGHFNKGPAFLYNKVHEVESIIQDHHPHLLGLSEANFFHSHDLNDVSIQDYDIYFLDPHQP